MTDQYNRNEKNRLDDIGLIEGAIPNNLNREDFPLAVYNYGRVADRYVDLGLLHWRHGLDPRPDFENSIEAYEKMIALARDYGLPKNVAEIPIVYAMLSLMGRRTPIEFEDEDYHEQHRWPCYQCCLVHALHDQPLNERHAKLLDQYLAENDELPDRTFLTYFQLLGMRLSERSPDELVKSAEANWTKRKRDKFFSDAGAAFDGYGVMNDIYVDVYLAAVLQKIGWQGESVHRWKWETPRRAR